MTNYLMRAPKVGTLSALTLVFIILAVLVAFSPRYYVEVIIGLVIIFIAVASYRFIAIMGRWSFAHAQILGLGGYVSAILVTRYECSFWVTLLLGGIAAALVALLLSYPVIRTSGFYFFMSTFVAGAAIAWFWTRFDNPFGGPDGLFNIPRPASIHLSGLLVDFNQYRTYAFLALLVCFLCLIILYRLEKTRLFSILKSIASHPELAKSVGINTFKYETIGFTIGCFFAGIAGVLYVHHLEVASPSMYSVDYAINLLVFTVVGGVQNFWGPLIGASVFTAIGEGISGFLEYVPLVLGIVLLLVTLVLPGGLVSLPQRILLWKRGGTFLSSRAEIEQVPIVRDLITPIFRTFTRNRRRNKP